MKLKLNYNAPVTLTFALISALILLIDTIFKTGIIPGLFQTYGSKVFDSSNPAHFAGFFTNIFGHADWPHLLGNFSFILLLGPQLEEKYGKGSLLFMIIVTAVITSLLHFLLSPNGALLGASGIVFMMILLSSFTRVRSGEIPLTFILVVILFLTKEIIAALEVKNGISELAHIAGGLCGAFFGFRKNRKIDLVEAPAETPSLDDSSFKE